MKFNFHNKSLRFFLLREDFILFKFSATVFVDRKFL